MCKYSQLLPPKGDRGKRWSDVRLYSNADLTYLLASHYSSCTYVDVNAKNRFSAELCNGGQRAECFVEDLREKASNTVSISR